MGESNILDVRQNRNSPNCTILDSWVFDNFILADEPLAKDLQMLETCVSVNNTLCRILLSSLEWPAIFILGFKVTLVLVFITDFDLLRCEFNVILSHFILIFILNQNKFIIPSQFFVKNLKWFLLLIQ